MTIEMWGRWRNHLVGGINFLMEKWYCQDNKLLGNKEFFKQYLGDRAIDLGEKELK